MEDYPNTVLEFEQKFATEQDCQAYLFRLRWPDGFRCPGCGHNKAWLTSRGILRCRHRDYQSSVTAGTIFHGSRKPLRLWFRAIWHVTTQKHGVSALGLQRVLGLGSYQTAWTWLHRLRRAMVRPGRERLSGIVEADETYVGGERPGKRGRGAAGKTLVVVFAEDTGTGIGRIRLHRVKNASADSLTAAVESCVETGSEVGTDDWDGYLRLEARGYRRTIARKTAEVGENLLPLANRVAALLKRWLLGTHQGAVQPSHLDYYLDEFTFRFNRHTSRSRGKLFYRLVQQAAAVEPISNKDILAGRYDR